MMTIETFILTCLIAAMMAFVVYVALHRIRVAQEAKDARRRQYPSRARTTMPPCDSICDLDSGTIIRCSMPRGHLGSHAVSLPDLAAAGLVKPPF